MSTTTAQEQGLEERMIRLKERTRLIARQMIGPLARVLVGLHIHPDVLTAIGVLSSLAAGLAFFEGGFRAAAALVALSGLCDMLDGELARRQAVVSKFGAFLDSTLDRLSEAAILIGIAGFYLVNLLELAHDPSRVLAQLERGLEPRTWAVVTLTAVLALVASYLVSYTRARAEALGLDCRVGWFERPERMVVLIVAAAFGVGPVMPGALLLLTVLSFATAIQRVVHVWESTRRP
jgi:CDP-diacylglycerol--glycerol-3-phosphate 3-phosphatidyltransferase